MRFVPEIVALVVMITVLLFVRAQFAAMVEPALLNAWLAFMAFCVVARMATLRLSSSQRWRARLPATAWVRIGQAITFGFCAGIVASVWILMPPADDLLRLLLIILCMWFIAMVIILNADRASVIGAIAVVCSMAAFALHHRIPYAVALAGFLVMEGVALILIRRTISRSSQMLQSALHLVQAERDARTRFIAAASHDLQQPLQAARLYFEHAVETEAVALRERAVLGARAAFVSIDTLLQSMLDHLRMEADAMPVHAADLRLSEGIDAVIAEHQPTARAAGMRVRRVGDAAVTADAHLLHRVLGNLLSNAVRHSGGTRVTIVVRQRDGMAEIAVLDDGRGVAAGDASRLFAEYYQAEAADRPRGLGLGLATAKRMATLLGGELYHEPRWTAGAAFVLRMPVREG